MEKNQGGTEMSRELDEKIEASLPAQSRIDIRTLASLDIYWADQNYEVRTVSQLISWSLDLMLDVLCANGFDKKIEDLAVANRYLISRRLRQPSMVRKGRQKLGTAMTMNSLRDEGIDPEGYAPTQYNMLHRKGKRQIEPYDEPIKLSQEEANREYYKEQRELRRQKEAEIDAEIKRQLDAAKLTDICVGREESKVPSPISIEERVPVIPMNRIKDMSSEEFMRASQERDRKIAEIENADFDTCQLEGVKDDVA